MTEFDVAVIGAGPAGSVAAKHASMTGCRVCLLERREQVSVPVRCGEGIGYHGLFDHLEHPKKEWIKNTTKKAAIVSPSGIKVQISDSMDSYILDRTKMDNDLIKDALASGVSYHSLSPVTSIVKIGDKYECRGPQRTVTASCVILADGVESRLARFVGWDTSLQMCDIETSAFTRVVSPFIEQDTCVFFVGSKVAPGGYAWIFPRGAGEANVGLGILGMYSEAGKAKEYLLRLIENELPGGRIGEIHCGGIPVAKYMRPLVKDGVMLVGDAARQVNALTGGGISYSLFAGKECGRVAGEAFKGGVFNKKHLLNYERIWRKRFGKQQERSYTLKKFLVKYADDAFMERIRTSVSKEDPSKLNYLRLFLRTFAGHPLLLLKVFDLYRS
jgi:digeranylgeranylglycerophospholipid reductase